MFERCFHTLFPPTRQQCLLVLIWLATSTALTETKSKYIQPTVIVLTSGNNGMPIDSIVLEKKEYETTRKNL